MRGAIAWSYELLEPEEQALFRALGVFRGGFTLAAAASVSGRADGEVAAGVESLLTKSLLQRPVSVGRARYAMLELVREFALERLADAGEHTAVAALHARYYARLAATLEPELTGDDSAAAVDQLTLGGR